MDIETSTVIDDRYKILRLLGQGGFACVFEAHHLTLDRLVALKFLLAPLGDEETTARFNREANILCRLAHKNITTFYGYGIWHDHAYFVMELVRGVSLEKCIDNDTLSLPRTIAIFKQVLAGISYAHARGIIHRDLKPSNVVLTIGSAGENIVKIIDFGLAKADSSSEIKTQKLTEAGLAVGTIQYMSPEQCQGLPATAASDIYSLGCMLYHALTGKAPFQGERVAVMLNHVSDTPPTLPNPLHQTEITRLGDVLSQCLEKSPRNRFASVDDLMTALDQTMVDHLSDDKCSILLAQMQKAPDANRGAANDAQDATTEKFTNGSQNTSDGRNRFKALSALAAVLTIFTVAPILAIIGMPDSNFEGVVHQGLSICRYDNNTKKLKEAAAWCAKVGRPLVAAAILHKAAEKYPDNESVEYFSLLMDEADVLKRAHLLSESEARYGILLKEISDCLNDMTPREREPLIEPLMDTAVKARKACIRNPWAFRGNNCDTAGDLGRLASETRQIKAAELFYSDAIQAMRQLSEGERDSHILDVYSRLAHAYIVEALSAPTKAESREAYQKAQQTCEAGIKLANEFKLERFENAALVAKRGQSLIALGDVDLGKKLMHTALKMDSDYWKSYTSPEELNPIALEEHVQRAAAKHEVFLRELVDVQDWETADEIYKLILDTDKKNHGNLSIRDVTKDQLRYAGHLVRKNKFVEAKKIFDETLPLAIAQYNAERFDINSLLTFEVWNMNCERDLGNFDKAATLAVELYSRAPLARKPEHWKRDAKNCYELCMKKLHHDDNMLVASAEWLKRNPDQQITSPTYKRVDRRNRQGYSETSTQVIPHW